MVSKDLEKDIHDQRFSGDFLIYKNQIVQLLNEAENLDFKSDTLFFELLESILWSIPNMYAIGNLDDDIKMQILNIIKKTWSDLPNKKTQLESNRLIKGSIITIAGLLIPFDGVKSWLLEIAHLEKDLDLAKHIRDTFSNFDRSSPII